MYISQFIYFCITLLSITYICTFLVIIGGRGWRKVLSPIFNVHGLWLTLNASFATKIFQKFPCDGHVVLFLLPRLSAKWQPSCHSRYAHQVAQTSNFWIYPVKNGLFAKWNEKCFKSLKRTYKINACLNCFA